MSRQTYMDATRSQYTDVCVGFNATKSITNTIINFYSQFDRYDHLTYVDLYQHISPSIRNNQFKVFHTNGKIWGFANWALLNDNILQKFFNKGKLYTLDWTSGINLCYVDVVASRHVNYIMKWLRNHSVTMVGQNHPIYWIRSTKHKVKRITKTKTKGYWKWVE